MAPRRPSAPPTAWEIGRRPALVAVSIVTATAIGVILASRGWLWAGLAAFWAISMGGVESAERLWPLDDAVEFNPDLRSAAGAIQEQERPLYERLRALDHAPTLASFMATASVVTAALLILTIAGLAATGSYEPPVVPPVQADTIQADSTVAPVAP